jgi:TIR domain
MEQSGTVVVFCCYAHKDVDLLCELKSHLSSLERLNVIKVWDDGDINAGAEWGPEIKKHLNEAKIILLLISPAFINSDYCYSTEMRHALERHKQREARVIPIIVRHITGWEKVPPGDIQLGNLQALPKEAKPVKSWTDRDEAWKEVAEGIGRVVNELPQTPPNRQKQMALDKIEKLVPGVDISLYQETFDLALRRSIPGTSSGYVQTKEKGKIDRVLSSLAQICEECELWWFAGSQNCPADPIKKLDKDNWLIQWFECRIIDLCIYRSYHLERQYVLLHLAPQPPLDIYKSYNQGTIEEAGYYQGQYVTRGEFDDGYAEIDGEIVKIDGAELRCRNLKTNFLILAPKHSVYNNEENDQQTEQVYQNLLKIGRVNTALLQPLEHLKRPKWMD